MTHAESNLQAETRRLREETMRLLEQSRAERARSAEVGQHHPAPAMGHAVNQPGPKPAPSSG